MADTRAQLRARAKQRADMVEGGIVEDDDEWNGLLLDAYEDLWDLVADQFKDHFVTSTTATVSTAPYTITLPADFARLRSVEYRWGSTSADYVEIEPFDWSERNALDDVKYQLAGGVLYVRPESLAAGTYQIWYYIACPGFANDAATIDARVASWDEYVVLDAAIQALTKEETDASALERRRDRIIRRIEKAARIQVARPRTTVDVEHWHERRILPRGT